VYTVFLHYLGNEISSILVLIAGILGKVFQGQEWTNYVDPITSLLIVVLIIWTTFPLLKECSEILLQQVPSKVEIPHLKKQLLKVADIQGIHDLHVWQLGVDNIIIASLHVSIFQTDTENFNTINENIKKVMHKFGIHSSTIQLEFIYRDAPADCDQNCVEDCLEDWCCKSNDLNSNK